VAANLPPLQKLKLGCLCCCCCLPAAEGLEVIRAVTQVPTFTPNSNSRAFNDFANFIGDDRAAKTKSKWGRPLQAILITSAGVLNGA
jgi:peptidyl-prolyl cis-trans isomerase B (cyclophilin B)